MLKKDPSLEAIFQTPGLFVGILDEEGNLLDANQAALNFINYKLGDLKGKKFWKTPWWNHSEKLRKKLKERVQEAKNEGMARFEADHFSPGGKKVTVDFILHSMGGENNQNHLLALGRDITERKEAEEKYKIVAQGSSQPIYLFQDGQFKYVNESFEKLSGYNREELKNIDFRELIHPDFREEIAQWTRQALAGEVSGLPERVEYKVLTKEGKAVWVRSLPSPVEYQGSPAIAGNAVDITEEKEMEKKLRAERDLFESIMTLTPDLVYFKDDQHRFKRVCKSYTSLLGLDEADMIGKTAERFWPEEAEEIMEDERRALDGESVIGKERQVTLPNGEKRWYSINKLPRRAADGNIVGLLGMDRNITKRKKKSKLWKKKEASSATFTTPLIDYSARSLKRN